MTHTNLADHTANPEEKSRTSELSAWLHLDTCEEVAKDELWEALLETFYGPCPETGEEGEAEEWTDSFAFDETNIECAAYSLIHTLEYLLAQSVEPRSLSEVLAQFEAGKLGASNPTLLDGYDFGDHADA